MKVFHCIPWKLFTHLEASLSRLPCFEKPRANPRDSSGLLTVVLVNMWNLRVGMARISTSCCEYWRRGTSRSRRLLRHRSKRAARFARKVGAADAQFEVNGGWAVFHESPFMVRNAPGCHVARPRRRKRRRRLSRRSLNIPPFSISIRWNSFDFTVKKLPRCQIARDVVVSITGFLGFFRPFR